MRHQASADDQHLLLPAREGTGQLIEPLPKDREMAQDPGAIALQAMHVPTDVRSHKQILLDRQLLEDRAALLDMRDPKSNDLLGVKAVQTGPHEFYGPFGGLVFQEAADRL
jgi:hypothetical protein